MITALFGITALIAALAFANFVIAPALERPKKELPRYQPARVAELELEIFGEVRSTDAKATPNQLSRGFNNWVDPKTLMRREERKLRDQQISELLGPLAPGESDFAKLYYELNPAERLPEY